MVVCAVKGCKTRSGYGNPIPLYRIPRIIKHQGERDRKLSEDRRRQFLANIYRSNVSEALIENMRVCARHFVLGKPANFRDNTNVDWAPTLFLGHNNIRLSHVIASHQRHLRAVNRRIKKSNHEAAETLISLQSTQVPVKEETVETLENESNGFPEFVITCEGNPNSGEESKAAPPDETLHEINPLQSSAKDCIDCKTKDATIASLDLEIQNLRSELYTLRRKVTCLELTEDTLKEDDSKVRFYTGLPTFAVLQLVFTSVKHAPCLNHRNSLTPFQEYLLTLIKLRLNMPLQDLSYRFHISITTATRIFNKWVKLLALNLKNFPTCTEGESLQISMSLGSQQSSGENTAVIIDSVEIPIEGSSSATAKNTTGVQEKHMKTVKFFIGITTKGSVSFVSRVWDGGASDKHATENSGTLNGLSAVLAYEATTAADSLKPNCTTLTTPEVTNGEKQLTAVSVAETRDIGNVQVNVNDMRYTVAVSAGPNCAKHVTSVVTNSEMQLSAINVSETGKTAHVKVHVKKIISQVRQKYSILNDRMPYSFAKANGKVAPIIDDIVTLCFALTNLCPSAVTE